MKLGERREGGRDKCAKAFSERPFSRILSSTISDGNLSLLDQGNDACAAKGFVWSLLGGGCCLLLYQLQSANARGYPIAFCGTLLGCGPAIRPLASREN